MTNPNNAIGTNGAYGGRTSVNAFNDNLAIFQGRGVLSGFVVSPNTGMSVVIGGDGTTRDVAIAEDNIGNKTTINNISESPISLTIAGAPASNSRIDAIVAYVDNPAQGSATETDNPSACGLIDIQGSVSATPSQPDENAIRTAITADGASGTTAYYVVLGYITVANGTTDITSNMISEGNSAVINTNSIADSSITTAKLNNGAVSNSKIANGAVNVAKIEDGAVSNSKIANGAVNVAKVADGAITPKKASFTAYSTTETVIGTWINGKPIYRRVIQIANPQTSNTDYGVISGVMSDLVNLYGYMKGSNGAMTPIPQTDSSSTYSVLFVQANGTLRGRFSYIGVVPTSVYVVAEYTKTTD